MSEQQPDYISEMGPGKIVGTASDGKPVELEFTEGWTDDRVTRLANGEATEGDMASLTAQWAGQGIHLRPTDEGGGRGDTGSTSVSMSSIPQERWDAIFSKREPKSEEGEQPAEGDNSTN